MSAWRAGFATLLKGIYRITSSKGIVSCSQYAIMRFRANKMDFFNAMLG
jgi:hypothetical protein